MPDVLSVVGVVCILKKGVAGGPLYLELLGVVAVM